ncbi:MAG: hypothetical protein QOG17_1559 [Gammaproteobacteria bacterium]|nr:hypothetical protein [Gammaproteobacteria bacterium]
MSRNGVVVNNVDAATLGGQSRLYSCDYFGNDYRIKRVVQKKHEIATRKNKRACVSHDNLDLLAMRETRRHEGDVAARDVGKIGR